MLQKQFLTDWKSRHFPLWYFFFEGKQILHVPTSTLCQWQLLWEPCSRRPCHGSGVVSASWSSNWKERNCKYNEQLLDIFPPTSLCVCVFFLGGIYFSFAATVLMYKAEHIAQSKARLCFCLKQQRKWSQRNTNRSEIWIRIYFISSQLFSF